MALNEETINKKKSFTYEPCGKFIYLFVNMQVIYSLSL